MPRTKHRSAGHHEAAALAGSSGRMIILYGAIKMRKWLIIKTLQQSAFFRIFSLTSMFISYTIGRV
jgi:hypothetical protein